MVSIIIPTYRRPHRLVKALNSVALQETDASYQVLVVDNGCDPWLKEMVRIARSHYSCQIRYLSVTAPGLHNGRHLGTLSTNDEILIFIDDDIEAAPGWLDAIVGCFADPDVHLVGGRYLPDYEQKPPEWIEAFWTRRPSGISFCGYLSLLDYGDCYCQIDPSLVWGVSFAIRRETLFQVGGFHPDSMPWDLRRYRGDGESGVSREIEKLGFKAVYHPNARLYHAVPVERMTLEYFEKRAYLQGISDSYSRIRREYLGGLKQSQKTIDWKYPLRKFFDSGLNFFKKKRSERYYTIKQRVAVAYDSGFAFHQNEVKRDLDLLRWVLKPDYWDCCMVTGMT